MHHQSNVTRFLPATVAAVAIWAIGLVVVALAGGGSSS